MADRTNDSTEAVRRIMAKQINSNPGERESLEAQHGQVWSTEELTQDFAVEGFLAPFVVVRRKSDGARGSMCFQHYPRFYWGFKEDE